MPPATSSALRAGRKCVVALNNRTLRKWSRARYIHNLPRSRSESKLTGKAICAGRVSVFLAADGLAGISPLRELLIEAANSVSKGSFLLFEKWFAIPGDMTSGDVIWRTDFTTGYVFPRELYSQIVAPADSAEIKVCWEFGRMQYLVPLALAYRDTRDSIYLDLYRRFLVSFHEENPLGVGVQWACTMEVGIRIFNVLVSFEGIASLLESDDELHELVAVLACEHGAHIASNLETSARLQENNHYVANLLGLAAISASYPSHPLSPKWREYVHRELTRSIVKQVLGDGSCFERSIRYSRLVGELFFYAAKALARTESALPYSFWVRLERLGSFLSGVTTRDGVSSQIGDNDSGRALALVESGYSDLRVLKHLVERELRRAVMCCADVPEEALLYGAYCDGPLSEARETSETIAPLQSVRVFPDIGIAQARLGIAEVFFCAIDGFDEWAEAGHTHNDKLSVLLSVRSRNIFVDPGTGMYTRDVRVRNILRGTAQHSTLWFRGLEQNEFKGLFGFRRMGGASLDVEEHENSVLFHGATDCYLSRIGCQHTRTVRLERPFTLTVVDSLSVDVAIGEPIRSFVLDPDVKVEAIEDRTLLLTSGDVVLLMESNARVSLREGLYSHRYGEVQRTLIVDSPFTFGEQNEVRVREFVHG